MFGALEVDLLPAGKNFVASVLFIPLGERRRHMHLLDDLSPPHTSLTCAKLDLTLLCRIRNDAHFGATEIVIEEVLEPHSRQEEDVPAVTPALLDILSRPVHPDLTVVAPTCAEAFIELH